MKFMEYNELKDREECVLDTSELKTNLLNKVDKVENKGLSTNDFTNELKDSIPQFRDTVSVICTTSITQEIHNAIIGGTSHIVNIDMSLSSAPENDGNWFIRLGEQPYWYYPVIVSSNKFICDTRDVKIEIDYSMLSNIAADVTPVDPQNKPSIKITRLDTISITYISLIYASKIPLGNEFLEPSVTIVDDLIVGGTIKQYGEPTENMGLITKKYLSDTIESILSFNENGNLVVTINGVTKEFTPIE